jgi:hypothetical protein
MSSVLFLFSYLQCMISAQVEITLVVNLLLCLIDFPFEAMIYNCSGELGTMHFRHFPMPGQPSTPSPRRNTCRCVEGLYIKSQRGLLAFLSDKSAWPSSGPSLPPTSHVFRLRSYTLIIHLSVYIQLLTVRQGSSGSIPERRFLSSQLSELLCGPTIPCPYWHRNHVSWSKEIVAWSWSPRLRSSGTVPPASNCYHCLPAWQPHVTVAVSPQRTIAYTRELQKLSKWPASSDRRALVRTTWCKERGSREPFFSRAET